MADLTIRDPVTGDGQRVNSEGMARNIAVVQHTQQHINTDHEESYSIVVSKTPTGAGDVFLYLKNTSDDDLVIFSANCYAATDESIQVKLGDSGTTSGGTANTPVNRNAGSGKTADCTCEDGVNITGLSGGSVVDEVCVDGATGTFKYRWWSGLILPKNSILTLYAVTGAVALKVVLAVGFHTDA